ncbi:MAG: 1-(5-phosphoribosyl)-5-[(5-phosphoribosylamino)methylideneamino] imidazole-4-carboxamide isomerase, partial [Acidobacteria bacterium]
TAFTRRGINFDFLRAVNQSVPLEKLMIAVDCLGDRVAVRGWSEVLPLTSGEALPQLEPYCSEFLCTYIDAEGKLRGTNIGWFRKLRATTRLPITAAGGITTDEEIRALEDLGMNAALGMAIYRKFFPELLAKS